MTGGPPHRVVVDPNVFISATTPNGALGPLLDLIDKGTLVPVLTQHLVGEVVDVLGRPKLDKYVQPGVSAACEEQMRLLGEWHTDIAEPPAATRDPKDDYLVALAIAARAEAIVSGDDDLHAARDLEITVLTPRYLLTRLGM